MRHLVLINPASSRGDTARAETAIRGAFGQRNLQFEIVRTQYAGHARELVREAGHDFEAIVAVGGDGTLHEVLQTLDLERHVIGVIPRGSGNDFAWMNGWPKSIEKCADRICAFQERRIDVGLWNERRFHTSVGVGFEAQVNEESRHIRGLRGPAIYLAAVARTLAKRRTYPVRLDWGQGAWEGELLLASIGNGKRVGGAFLLNPEARNDDGLLDVCFAPQVGLARFLGILPRTFNGSHVRSSAVQTQRGPQVRIQGPKGFPVHVDGEPAGLEVRHLDLTVAPRALRMF